MSDFSVRSDNVDVEQIMRQIRSRIREKRGVDYTEEEIRELANVKLEKFIDPKGVRSGLLEEYRRVSTPEPAAPNYAFGEDTLYETHRGPIRWVRALLRPFLKMLFNPNPLIQALHIQADLNQRNAERWAKREQLDSLHYEVIHNLVVEVTRSSLEVKSLKMRLESMASRLDFDERRARALEGVVQYRPGTVAPLQPPTGQDRGRRHDSRGPRPSGQEPRNQAPSSPGPGSRVPGPSGPESRGPSSPRQDPRVADASSPAPESRAAGPSAPGHNALDNDGNERRSRRRRRRGRRRPGEQGSPSGQPFRSGAPGAPGEAMPSDGGDSSSSDSGHDDTPDTEYSSSSDTGSATTPEVAATAGERADDRTSDVDPRSSAQSFDSSQPPAPLQSPGSEPPSE